MNIHEITKMAICAALICVSAYISVPLPFASAMVTALTLTMNLAAFVLKPWQTACVIAAYVATGVAGLPVFGAREAGPGVLLGPAGGFYISFIVAYPLVSALKGEHISVRRYSAAAILAGIPATYIGGLASLMLLTGMTLKQAALLAVVPFIPGDIAKAVAAAWLGARLNRIFGR